MENTTIDNQSENQELAEPQLENINDTSNMSDEEFEKNFDRIPDSTDVDEEILVEVNPKVKNVNEQQVEISTVENTEEQNISVNVEQTVEQTDNLPFDKELFNQLPEEYQKVFQPIKANGTEIQPTPEKMIQLMQLGSKYYADREVIKPQLQTVKALEKEGIDSDTLNFLIDINKGDKVAIAKLLSDKNIDIYDIDDSEADKYQPKDYRPQESELALENVISKIEHSPMFDSLLDNISKYDEQSKNEIKQNPEIMEILNEHLESGIYDRVNSVILEEKILGKHLNVPFVQVYKNVLDRMIANNEFVNGSNNNAHNEQVQQARQHVNQQQQQQQAFNTPSKALAPNHTRMTPTNVVTNNNQDESWGAMSDEEYLQRFGS